MPIKKRQFVKILTIPSDKEIKNSPDRFLDVDISRKSIFFNNLLGGIAWGLGATVGASIIIALLGFIIAQLHFIPIIGTFAAELGKYLKK